MEKRAETKAERLVTPPILAALIAFVAFSTIVCALTLSVSTVLTSWFVGPVYFVLVLELLGRRFPKFRLRPAQLLVLLLPLWYAAGKAFMVTGTGGEGLGWIISFVESFRVRALADAEVRDWCWDLTPSLVAPKDLPALGKAWRGLVPGEVIDWALWLPSTAFWSLWLIVTTLTIVILAYTIVGPQTVEVERLVYPMSVPATVLLSNAGTWIEVEGKAKSKLFDFTDAKIKAFWASFILGFVWALFFFINLIHGFISMPVLQAFAACVAGEIPLSLHLFTATLLPGAAFYAVLSVPQAVLMSLLPSDVQITVVVVWLIFYVIYPTLGVWLGVLPYMPGVESWANAWFGLAPPFPMAEFAATGLTLGIALLTLWEARGTIARVLKGEMAGAELPVKQLLYLLAGLFIVWLALWTAAGANPIMMIYTFILFILWQISTVRFYAEVWWHSPYLNDIYQIALVWPAGASIGAWSWEAAQKSQALYVQNVALVMHFGDAAFWQIPHNMGWVAHTYKWARDLNASLKDMLLILFAVAIVGWPLGMLVSTWWMHHVGGYIKLNYSISRWVVDYALNRGVRAFTPHGRMLDMPYWYHGLLTLLGVATVFAAHFLRARFAWLMINPTAMAATLWLPQNMWSASLIAFIARHVGIRLFGAKRYEEYAAYVAAGFCWGMGSSYLILGIYDLVFYIIPTVQAYYVP